MRYYLYQDKDAIKNIYASLENATFALETIEYIEQRCDINAENGFFEAKIHEGIKNGGKIEGGIDGANSRSITKISAYGNLEDIKNIHQNRFYHKLVEHIKKVGGDKANEIRQRDDIDNNRIYFKKGKVLPYVYPKDGNGDYNKREISSNEQSGKDKFALIDDTYLWLNADNISQDISLIGNITDEINTLGYVVKNSTQRSPKVVKVLAMYIE